MNIVMMTNTYRPILGGLEKSVESFSDEYRRRGHNVLIVTPEMKGMPQYELGVYRVPAIKNFRGTDFSIELPVSNELNAIMDGFRPDIIHSHHPFLIGDTALRLAAAHKVPIVFTHHSLYELNTHYVGHSRRLKSFAARLAVGYANLCDAVIAPSDSIARLLRERGVVRPLHVIPTGISLEQMKRGKRDSFRQLHGIPHDAFVVGIISRIAPEKNIPFLARAVASFLKRDRKAFFLVVGDGPSMSDIAEAFSEPDLRRRLITTGPLRGRQLAHAYAALDVLAFASHSETQGLILIEAMAAGKPVVAVDAPGVRDVVVDKKTGRLVPEDNVEQFVDALVWFEKQSESARRSLSRQARKLSEDFSLPKTIDMALALYQSLVGSKRLRRPTNPLKKTIRQLQAQFKIVVNTARAAQTAMQEKVQLQEKGQLL